MSNVVSNIELIMQAEGLNLNFRTSFLFAVDWFNKEKDCKKNSNVHFQLFVACAHYHLFMFLFFFLRTPYESEVSLLNFHRSHSRLCQEPSDSNTEFKAWPALKNKEQVTKIQEKPPITQ